MHNCCFPKVVATSPFPSYSKGLRFPTEKLGKALEKPFTGRTGMAAGRGGKGAECLGAQGFPTRVPLMHAKLIIVGGKTNRTDIRLKLPLIVGRSRGAGMVIAHPTVSRQHCELYEEDGKVFVRDLGSLNGTLVAEEQVQRGCLEHGTLLTIGPLTFQMVYEHLGAVPAPAAPLADDVHAETPTIAPDLSPTIVDMPRVGRGEHQDSVSPLETLSPAPLVDDSPEPDEGFALTSPSNVESDQATVGLVETQDLLSDAKDDPELGLDATETDAVLRSGGEEDSSDLSLFEDSADDLGFDLAPAPAQEDATSELAPPIEAATTSATQPPPAANAAPDNDDFLDMIAAETIVNETKPAAPGELVPACIADEVGPTPSVSAPEAEQELDWLEDTLVEATQDADAPADVDNGIPPDALAPVTVLMDEDVVEELALDEAEVTASSTAPPAVEPEPQPKAKKKRGLWPFGRKKKAEAAIKEIVGTQLELASPAAMEMPAELETPTVSEPLVRELVSAKTVIMDDLELEDAADVSPSAVTMVDISLTRELSHEKTVAIDDSVELALEAEPEQLVADAPRAKRKRGLFKLGGKKKTESGDAASSPAIEPVPLMEATDTPVAGSTTTIEVDAPVKKRGWWPFRKQSKATSTGDAAAAAAESSATKTSAAPIAATTAPSPESFEFSEAELLEITADVTPPSPIAANNPQALAADEVLDFDLDLPLDHASPSIEPVLSDEPPPTTGADDDDFLDFLAEELPGAKPKRNG